MTATPNAFQPTNRYKDKKLPLCNFGPTCKFYRMGICKFFHPASHANYGNRTSGITGDAKKCNYGDKCNRKETCKFTH